MRPAQIVNELKGKPPNKGIIDLILEAAEKKEKPEKFHFLSPTIANLFGLQSRFKQTDDKIKAELLRRKSMTKDLSLVDPSQALLMGETENPKVKIKNKHRLPAIKPREKFPSEMSLNQVATGNNDNFEAGHSVQFNTKHIPHSTTNRLNLNSSVSPTPNLVSPGQGMKTNKNNSFQRQKSTRGSVAPISTASPLGGPTPGLFTSRKNTIQGGELSNDLLQHQTTKNMGHKSSAFDVEELLNQYQARMTSLYERIENDAIQRKQQRQGMGSIARNKEEDALTGQDWWESLDEMQQAEYLEETLFQQVGQDEYLQKREQLKNAKIALAELRKKSLTSDVAQIKKQTKPDADDLLAMNVQEKNAFLKKRRQTLDQLDDEKGLTKKNKKLMEDQGILNKRSFDQLPHCMKNAVLNPPNQQKDSESSEQRNPFIVQQEEDAFNKFLGKAAPNKQFDEFAKRTEAQLNALQAKQKEYNLMEKKKHQGSLYGVPNTQEISAELAEQRATGSILTAQRIFSTQPLSEQYEVFIQNAMESIDQICELSGKPGASESSQTVWKKGATRAAEKQCNNEQIRDDRGISIGKAKRELDSALNFHEKQELKDDVKEQAVKLRQKIDKMYHDGFNSSIMMSKDNTVACNQIKRKFKWEGAKRHKLQTFRRQRREQIINSRSPDPEPQTMTQTERKQMKDKMMLPNIAKVKTDSKIVNDIKDIVLSKQAIQERETKARKNQFVGFVGNIMQKHVQQNKQEDGHAIQNQIPQGATIEDIGSIVQDRLVVKDDLPIMRREEVN